MQIFSLTWFIKSAPFLAALGTYTITVILYVYKQSDLAGSDTQQNTRKENHAGEQNY